MELQAIKDAISQYRHIFARWEANRGDNRVIEEEMGFLIERVLGYIEKKEVLTFKCGISRYVAPQEACDGLVKFHIEAVPPGDSLDAEILDRAVQCALKSNTSLMVLTNGRKLILYAVADLDGEIAQDKVFEFDLFKDDISILSENIWAICRKDCGRKIVVHMTRQ
jgi:hypothetical protein